MTEFFIPSFLLGIALVIGGPAGAQAQPRSDLAGPDSHPRGFFDYALGRINPADKDYGTTLEQVRGEAVRGSIDDWYFWSNVLTLVLLTGETAFLFLNLRASEKREVVCAALISQLWNARVSDRKEIEERTAEYNRLVESHNTEVERGLMNNSAQGRDQNEAASKLQKTVEGMSERVSSKNGAAEAVHSPATLSTARGKSDLTPVLEPGQQYLLLQRRIEAMKNTEANLKERLNQATQLLEQERSRNKSLKGA